MEEMEENVYSQLISFFEIDIEDKEETGNVEILEKLCKDDRIAFDPENQTVELKTRKEYDLIQDGHKISTNMLTFHHITAEQFEGVDQIKESNKTRRVQKVISISTKQPMTKISQLNMKDFEEAGVIAAFFC